mgnify:CR=1 FL=1
MPVPDLFREGLARGWKTHNGAALDRDLTRDALSTSTLSHGLKVFGDRWTAQIVLGGGIGLCGAADILVASTCVRFGVPEVDRGAMGGGAHLQRLFPVQKVRYLFFTGEKIGAREAERYGFIERIVTKAELRGAALDIARKIAEKSPAMIRIAKEALNGIEDGNLEDKYRWEQGFTLQAYMSPDSGETRQAFVQKRDAKF